MFALLLWLAASSAGAAPAVATPQLNELFTTDDYPVEALRQNKQGTVAARMKIDPGGAVIDCKVVRSSGSTLLDATTCAVIRARAHYAKLTEPDARIRSDSVRIKWVIPRYEGQPVADAISRFSFELAADGTLSNCVAKLNSKPSEPTNCDEAKKGLERMNKDTRDDLISRGHKLAFLGGYALGRDENGSLLIPIAGPGYLEGLTLSLTIDEHGSVTQCEMSLYDWEFASGEEDGPCKTVRKVKFEPLESSATNRGPRSLTVISALVVHD